MNIVMRKQILSILILFFPILLLAQQVIIEGYVFETGNRGYLGQAKVTILDAATKAVKGDVFSDEKGVFQMGLPAGVEYLIRVEKKPFKSMEKVVSTTGKAEGEKIFVKYDLERMPGYNFEVTLAPTRSDDEEVVDAITGARIEVYNNTIKKEVMAIEKSTSHVFNVRFEQGNHYTILIRKDKFFNKRLEAYVNVKGCILCFDGVGDVRPGVADVLTEGNQMGTLLANVELEPIILNKAIVIENIYYDYNSARIKTAAREELDKLVSVLQDNQSLLVEIGSHTDSRGDDSYNQKLSHKRAKSVVEYLVLNGISKNNMIAKGYGESKLVNKCKNGVECSERRHQKNRRTELKVVGFVNESLKDNRSLVELKEEEQFNEMLSKLGETEIKVEEGEEIPDEIKKQMEKKDNEAKEEVKEVKEIKEVVEDKKEEIKPVPKKEKPKKTTTKPSSSNTNVSTTITKRPDGNSSVGNKPEVKKTESVVVHKPQPERQPEPEVDPNAELDKQVDDLMKEAEEKKAAASSSARVSKDLDVTSLRELKKPKKLSKTYTGYRVEFITSMSELPVSHEIFTRHGNIIMAENKDGGFAYLLGDFEHKDDAELFLNNILIKRYPGARVVQYVKGRRVYR